MSDELTLEKLKIVEQLQSIAQNQAVMKQQIDSFRDIHDGVQKILERHDLMILGDGSTGHIGLAGRLKTLEDDMANRNTHHIVLYTGLVGIILEHLRHLFLGK